MNQGYVQKAGSNVKSKSDQQEKRNDYCQHFINTNLRPQNFIRDIKPEERFIDYPKLNELLKLKDDMIKKRNHPPMYVQADLKKFDLKQLGKFDIILCDPPWYEYTLRNQGYPKNSEQNQSPWTLEEIASLNLDEIGDNPSFLFLWVGSEHLEDGRELFRKWNYKRCEDICWVKTNCARQVVSTYENKENTILQRVKEHCLVGLKGDVKRASDAHFIHANIDTDVIVQEEPQFGSTEKPEEIYNIIERFCLGRKRLELFADPANIRPGWLQVGKNLPETNFDKTIYDHWFEGNVAYPQVQEYNGGRYMGTTQEIENLRPKSPKGQSNQQNINPIPEEQFPQQSQFNQQNIRYMNNQMRSNEDYYLPQSGFNYSKI